VAIEDSPLVRLDIVAPEKDVEAFTADLFEHIQYGWEELEEPGRTIFRVHVEDERIAHRLTVHCLKNWPSVSVRAEEVPNRNWALAWREFFTAVPCGERFVVIAPWMRQEQPFRDRIPVVIDPKMAFGTGHHPTTAICLETVSDLCDQGVVRAGQRFLDLGTGSGILGLGCAKLRLTGIGLDTDPLAIENALENRDINDVGPEFALHAGSLERLAELAPGERFDLVLANILAEPLIELAPQLAAALKPGGALVLSGLLTIQADAVAAAYTALGLDEPRRIVRDEWSALVFV